MAPQFKKRIRKRQEGKEENGIRVNLQTNANVIEEEKKDISVNLQTNANVIEEDIPVNLQTNANTLEEDESQSK